MTKRRHPKPCTDRKCHNGWIWYNGSEYPCSACAEYTKFRIEMIQMRVERLSEAYAFLF